MIVSAGSAVELALERARGFVEAKGSVLARERFDALLGDDRSRRRVEAVLTAWRCADGGFARLTLPSPVRPGAGTVAGALEALGVLDEARIRRGPIVEGVAAWLGPAQGDDGAWRAPREEGLASEDADPIFLTGMLAGHLAKLPCGSPRTLERAEAYLTSCFTPDLLETGDWRSLTAYTHLCSNGGGELADEALQWCGRALEKGLRSGRLRPLDAARALLVGDVRTLPGTRTDTQRVASDLLAEQEADGSFAAEGSTHDRVEATLLGARALVRAMGRRAAWTPA